MHQSGKLWLELFQRVRPCRDYVVAFILGSKSSLQICQERKGHPSTDRIIGHYEVDDAVRGYIVNEATIGNN